MHIQRVSGGIQGEFRVQAEVKQRKLQLTHHRHAGLEVLGRQQLLQQVVRQRLTGFMVRGDQGQGLGVPAPVFQELAGQLDGVPGNAIDSGYVQHIHLGEHVVQAVPELVEQRGDLIVGQQ